MTVSLKSNNNFSLKYYKSFIEKAKDHGYKFATLKDFLKLGCPRDGYVILRHDLDLKPQTLQKMIFLEKELEVKSTIFARVTGNEYNLLSYPVLNMLTNAFHDGFEIGLHTSCVEFGEINNLDPFNVLSLEVSIMKNLFPITGIAPHRDINYAYNSLPYIEKNWNKIKAMGIEYHAYQPDLSANSVYINEGFNPHLCWRNHAPEDVIPTGQTMYILTHNHWWYDNHPFEEWR